MVSDAVCLEGGKENHVKVKEPKWRGVLAKMMRYVGFTVTKSRSPGSQGPMIRHGSLHPCPALRDPPKEK